VPEPDPSQELTDFVAALTPEELESFRACGRVRCFAAGEVVFREFDDPGGVLAVVSGHLKVSLSGVGGRELVLGFPGPGELVGELAAVADRPRSATVTAVDAVEAILVRAGQFRGFIAAHPRLAGVMFERVAAMLAAADRQRVDLATRDVTGRVAKRLLELAERALQADAGPSPAGLELSQEELAAWTGASREAVAKSLHLLRELGWVQTARRKIKVLDPAALRTLVS
jgi:CRP-like cAMP-binding protein